MKKTLAATVAAVALFAGASQAQKIEKTEKVGTGIYEIIYNEKDNTVYVAAIGTRGEPGTANIYKLDPKTLAVKGTINTGEKPGFGLGINRTSQTLYTSNTRNNSVHAIDLKSGKIVATIDHGQEKSHTREIVADENNNKIYVSNMTDIWVIDGKTNKFSHLIEGLGEGITGLSLDEKNQILYTTDMRKSTVIAVDLKTNKAVKTFASGGENAINVFFDAKGKRLFVANQTSGTLTVLDTDGKLIKSVATGAGALSVNFDAKLNRIYVTNRGAGTTSIVDGKSYEILAALQTGSHPQTVAVDQKTGRVFVTNKAKGRPRPAAGQPAPTGPAPVDPTGDVVTIISPK